MTPPRPLRIATIAPLRYPIRQPHAGGVESALWNEVATLRSRGHHVDLVAPRGSDFMTGGPAEYVMPAVAWAEGEIAADDTYPAGYLDDALPRLDAALDRIRRHADDYDVVVNHCLHGLPLERAGSLGVPVVSTLHTPVIPELLAADRASVGGRSTFLSVSRHTADEWSAAGVDSVVLPNGVDESLWPLGPGGAGLVWFGRLVPEKGTHLAIEAARLLDLPLTIVGRIGDQAYFDHFVAPALGDRVAYVGPLGQAELAELVGRSACSLTTPVWAEPFGLVVPEALMTGTPVAAHDVGGVTEIARGSVGITTVTPGDPAALAVAARDLIEASRTPGGRDDIRASTIARFSLGARVDRLEEVLRATVRREGLRREGLDHDALEVDTSDASDASHAERPEEAA
ncbi:glycosyltransferase [Frigoribacterium sp. CFBP 13712]|uniref:glycosyltransferase n=1 Tax=Frigoribacterium sp. CFBP 13712 TaxID=2775309 RepID=UPI00177C6CA2|nr:glycosyltransferase [Frigoribacterium sp. CFBP 13712]